MASVLDRSVRVHCDPDNFDDYEAYMACCSDLRMLASDDDYAAWEAAREAGYYPDECPELPPSDYYDPTENELEWLLSQRPDCLDMPKTLAELDREIEALRRRLGK